jgi:hypothetical protein
VKEATPAIEFRNPIVYSGRSNSTESKKQTTKKQGAVVFICSCCTPFILDAISSDLKAEPAVS